MENTIFTIHEDDEGRRIDRVLRKFLTNLPLSGIYAAMRRAKIKINGKNVKPAYITHCNDKLEIQNSLIDAFLQKNITAPKVAVNKSIEPSIILKTEDLLFINKKIGETVHGENSLCSSVLEHFPAKGTSLSFTPGPLHRLDKNTSGIITFSQSLKGAQKFSAAIQNGKIEKYYIGIIEGLTIKEKLESLIDGKKCVTFAKILASSKTENISLVKFKLVTGRKHQIRIQCGQFGTPLLNDKVYGSKQKLAGTKNYFLHAFSLVFKETLFTGIPKSITAPFPAYFKKCEDLFGIKMSETYVSSDCLFYQEGKYV